MPSTSSLQQTGGTAAARASAASATGPAAMTPSQRPVRLQQLSQRRSHSSRRERSRSNHCVQETLLTPNSGQTGRRSWLWNTQHCQRDLLCLFRQDWCCTGLILSPDSPVTTSGSGTATTRTTTRLRQRTGEQQPRRQALPGGAPVSPQLLHGVLPMLAPPEFRTVCIRLTAKARAAPACMRCARCSCASAGV